MFIPFTGLLQANIKNLFGNNALLAWNKEINHVADVVYYFLTTAGGLQTLGEEYTNLIQVAQCTNIKILSRSHMKY